MISSYLKLALRHLIKHKLYALINILGLALGLTIFLFGVILVNYENNHDNMFAKRERTFTVGSVFSPNAGTGIREYPNVRTAYAPLFRAEIGEAELVARSINRVQLLSIDNNHYYQNIRFVEKGFTDIFDFNYLKGDKRALNDPSALIITESSARKLFGDTNVVGQVLTLSHQLDMHIAAVIEDVAADSHFNSSFLPDNKLAIFAPLQALVNLGEFDMAGSWQGLDPNDYTYILLPENKDRAWLQGQVEAVSLRHAPEEETEHISALKVRPLIEANTQIWDAFGFPVLISVQMLGLMILIIACLNYTNLATAQSFGRTKEVGLRKTFGAGHGQLLIQFLIESISLAFFAMLIAVAGIELLLPLYNAITGKEVSLDYLAILPWLLVITLAVGLLAGAYPAYLISRLSPIDSLRNAFLKGRKGVRFRSLMIASQFAISIFMLAMVMIINFQNGKMKELSSTFLDAPTLILKRVAVPQIQDKHETLRQELMKLPGVQGVSFSGVVPYRSSGNVKNVTPTSGDQSQELDIHLESIDTEFLANYRIPLLAGRPFDLNIANDIFNAQVEQVNVIINQLAANRLGLGQGDQAIGKLFFNIIDEDNPQPQVYKVIGLIPDQYFYGTHSDISPMAFYINPTLHSFASIKLEQSELSQTINAIEDTWKQVIDDYPVEHSFLDFYFNLFFRFPEGINNVLTAFAGVALSLALFGLFGLAAFMAQRRTKEIGIRKVMGASIGQIVRLLIWQFSKPVLWSILVAIPLAYLASSTYLDFFPERIDYILPLIVLACAIGIVTAWTIVAGHAIKIARATPIRSLRYE